MKYADVAVDITAKALDRPFQYLVPEELEAGIEEGAIVKAPFGNGNREITGYVLSLSDQPKLPGAEGRNKWICLKNVTAVRPPMK